MQSEAQKPTVGNSSYDSLRRSLILDLLINARTFRKEILRRELTPEEDAQIKDYLKKFERETANKFLRFRNEAGYKVVMVNTKRRFEARQDYLRQMLDVQQKYLQVLEQYIAKMEVAIARNIFPEKLNKLQKELNTLQTLEKHIRTPHLMHPTRGLGYIKDVRNAMELLKVVETLEDMLVNSEVAPDDEDGEDKLPLKKRKRN